MIVNGKCDLCDTMVEIHVGNQKLVYTQHTPAACETLTKYRLQMLQRMLREEAEQHAMCRHRIGWLTQRLRDVPREIAAWADDRGVAPQVLAAIVAAEWLPSEEKQRERADEERQAAEERLAAMRYLDAFGAP